MAITSTTHYVYDDPTALAAAIQSRIDEISGEKTEYRIYEALVGGIIPK